MRNFFLCLLLAAALTTHARAQYIGNVGLQTQQQTLATNTACTGSAQTFAVNNLGQTQHYLSVTTGTQPIQFQAEIDGIDKAGNVFRISDMMQNAFTALVHQGQGSITASGYFPKIQVSITCSPNTATFTATYSGSQVTFNQDAGTYLNAQIDKVDFSNAAAGANISDTFTTPFGSTSGTLYVSYSASGPSGSTINVQCNTNQFTTPAIFTATLATAATLQTFRVPGQPCPSVTVNYVSGGASAAVVTSEYVLDYAGLPGASQDPCQNGAKKSSAPIAFGGGTTTQVVAAVTGLSVYVCGYQLSEATGAGTFQWEYGTGVACAGGTNGLTGTINLTANQPVSYSGPGTVATAPTSNALCLVTTGTGNAEGIVTYVQSP